MNPRGFFTIAAGVFVVGVLTRQITLLTVGLLAMLILGAAWGWQRFCLTGVEYTRRLAEDHIFWGETTELTISLVNRKLLPLSWIETDEEFSAKLEFEGHDLEAASAIGKVGLGHTTSLRWFERVNWRYAVHCEHRGLYLFDTVSLRSGDIFGLYTRHEERPIRGQLFVYPRMVPLPELGMPARYPFGDVRAQHGAAGRPGALGGRARLPARRSLQAHPLEGHGPPPGIAGARLREDDARRRSPSSSTSRPSVYYWEGIEPERAEWAISVAASLARYADEQRYSVGLYTNAGGDGERRGDSHPAGAQPAPVGPHSGGAGAAADPAGAGLPRTARRPRAGACRGAARLWW